MNTKPKTFIILSPGFASSETDTSCLPMQQGFVRTLAGMYPETEIIVLSFQYPFFRKTYNWFGATVISFNGQNKGGLTEMFLRRQVSRELKAIQKTKHIVGLLSFWFGECAYVGKKFAEKENIIHYCWLFGQDAKAGNKYFKRISIRSNELIALSEFLQEEFQKNYNIKPSFVIPPGIDEANLLQGTRDIDLLAVGSLIPLKQFEIFIETVAAIATMGTGVKALLIGEGCERDKLQKLIDAYNLEDVISLTGEIEYPEVLRIMQRTKILLHPSSYEGYSGVCQEALANGAHVISFCRAMNEEIPQWHIVKSKREMVEKANDILTADISAYKKTGFPTMTTTVKNVMQLYLQGLQ